jgi:hypothetical protein
MLLESRPLIFSGVIFEAINADNHVGLARILNSGKAKLVVSGNELCYFKRDRDPALWKGYKKLTCLTYARILRKTDFERFLESYGFKAGSDDTHGVVRRD